MLNDYERMELILRVKTITYTGGTNYDILHEKIRTARVRQY